MVPETGECTGKGFRLFGKTPTMHFNAFIDINKTIGIKLF